MNTRPANLKDFLKNLNPLSLKEKKKKPHPSKIYVLENPNYLQCLSAGFKIAKGSKAHLCDVKCYFGI